MKIILKPAWYMSFVIITIIPQVYASTIKIPADYSTIQEGIEHTINGDSIIVSPGIYVENINFNGKNIVVTSVGGAENTVINGGENGSVIIFESGEDYTAVLNGFSIMNGSGTIGGPYGIPFTIGGGLFIVNSSPTLSGLVVYDNSAEMGGGMEFHYSSSDINNIILKNNRALGQSSSQGGGIRIVNSNITMNEISVQNNWAYFSGAGIFIISSGGTINNSAIFNNYTASGSGGGISISLLGTPTLNHVLIHNNSAELGGGVSLWGDTTFPVFNHVTITENVSNYGGGIILKNGSAASFVNSILWNNSPQQIYFYEYQTFSYLEIAYTDVQGGEEGIVINGNGWVNWWNGNLDTDPLFVYPAGEDFNLLEDSPCIDAGDPDSPPDPDGTVADMGTFPFNQLQTLMVDYLQDWNLVGLPIVVEDHYYMSVFPDAIEGTMYQWSHEYLAVETLVYGEGYWLRFEDESLNIITGMPINEVVVSVNEGWNLISGISSPAHVSGIIDNDGLIVPGTLYGFGGYGYVNAEWINPGYGYWVRSYSEGEIIIINTTISKYYNFINRLEEANTITFNGQLLYYGVAIPENEKLSYSLPPKPPPSAFDVRFNGDLKICNNYGEIEIINPYKTLTISYNVTDGEAWLLQNNSSGEEYLLESNGEIIINTYPVEKFTLSKLSTIPKSYVFHQNYPNPFNNITTLNYELTEQSDIKIVIYDIVGRQIKQLVNTVQEAGYWSVTWDATDDIGKSVSAGIYLFRIHANNFVQNRKLVLLK